MSFPVTILLDQRHKCFTNLDEISGRIQIMLSSQETIAQIHVKLEGESRSRLVGGYQGYGGPGLRDPYARDQVQMEIHKLLYKVAVVFPTPEMGFSSSRDKFTLSPGKHEYPFKFKIPFNNDCVKNASTSNAFNSIRADQLYGANAHVKRTLPPTLLSLPGEAEIQYYIKVTVQRPAFYKENWRREQYFVFMPIEPPRPPPSLHETYARVHHEFSTVSKFQSRSGIFKRKSSASVGDAGDVTPPSIAVEGRLPDPPIVTCNEPLPLRLLVTLLNDSPATLYVKTLSIELCGYTVIRANHLRRDEPTSWVIVSTSGQQIPLTSPSLGNSKVMEIPDRLWSSIPLHSSVTPSFQTCNIIRNYVLQIKVGLSWGNGGIEHPELTTQQVRMPVQIFSGIRPPQALLDAMAASGGPGQEPPRPPVVTVTAAPPAPPSPSDHIEPSPEDIPVDAPPSYEDALADAVPAIDGPRRSFHQGEHEKGPPRLFDENA